MYTLRYLQARSSDCLSSNVHILMANTTMQRHDWIHQVALVAFIYGIQRRSKDAGDLGVRLCLVSEALKNADPGELAEEEIQELSEVIRELESISKVLHTTSIESSIGRR